MNVSFEEIGQVYATFQAQNAAEGQVCKMSGNGKVTGCGQGEKFCGLVDSVRGDYAGVLVRGFVKVAYSGTAPAVGYAELVADGNGGIMTGSGREHLVVSVDERTQTAIIEL